MASAGDITGIGSIVTGAMGEIAASQSRAQAAAIIQKNAETLQRLGVPPVEIQRIFLQHLQSAGKLTPELESTIKQGTTNLANVTTDPKLRGAQLSALNKLQEVGNSGGMTLADKATQEDAMGKAQAAETGSRKAILSSIRDRGQLGSGLELTAQLDNQQKSANQQHEDALRSAGSAQSRALQAIQASGNLGGQLRGQDFSEGATKASAQDAIDTYNNRNAQAVAGANVNRTNSANEFNLKNDQRIADANVGTDNYQEQYNKNLIRQNYQDELNKGIATNNSRNQVATNLSQNADRTNAVYSNIGQGLGELGSAAEDRQMTKDYLDKKYGSGSNQDDSEEEEV